MKTLLLSGMSMLSLSAFAQNNVSLNQTGSAQEATISQHGIGNSININQTGGPSGNQATVSQSGGSNTVRINQSSTSISDSSQSGNRVSLRVQKGTQTTINQDSPGPNSVELNQEGQATAIINQSSGTDKNSVTTLPGQEPATPKNRSTKRPKRR